MKTVMASPTPLGAVKHNTKGGLAALVLGVFKPMQLYLRVRQLLQ
jgi:hypothetical protein